MDHSSITTEASDDVLSGLKTSADGLSSEEANAIRAKHGFNEIAVREFHWWEILWRQFNSPFIFLLIGATVLSFVLGEKIDGLIIIAFIVINAVLGFSQEYHSARSLELLKQYVVPHVRVRRQGHEEMVPSRELVPGDIVLISAGDIIPADLRFIETTELLVNESVLTGESVPIQKTAEALKVAATAPHEALNIGFSGTTTQSGEGVGVVVATGRNTALGDITRLTVETHHVSGFEKGISSFSKFILRMILVILVLLFVVNMIIKGGETNLFELVLFSIALAVSVVPEALPVVTTIALSKGAVKMAKHHVVVKRLSAVEDLGSIDVLCTDKTGTLTENKLSVSNVESADPAACLEAAVAASANIGEKKRDANNAFDLALWEKLAKAEQESILKNYHKVSEIPFDPDRRRNSVLIKKGSECELIVRGAPESVLALCTGMHAGEMDRLDDWIAAEGERGNRVIAVATKSVSADHCQRVSDEHNLTFSGIISFNDPIKSTAKHALDAAGKLGLKIKILTGDNREVAAAVAEQVGLVHSPSEVMTGSELEKLSAVEQLLAVEKTAVFARVSPQQKFSIIKLLQQKYEVGFLGEGINDAPALKLADVGIVVSDASDIAREAADIVLLKKSLSVIVDGIREGREIFANTIKYIKATLISNFGNFYAIAVASLLITFLPMLPVQILLLNLLSDFPMISIATDSVDKNELRRPRSYNVREVVLVALILGAVSTIFDFIFFAAFVRSGEAVLQTNWFMGSVLTELALIFSIRTRGFFLRASRPALGLVALSVVATGAAIVLPFSSFGHRLLGFESPTPLQFITVIGIALAYFVTTECVKLLYYRHTAKNEQASMMSNKQAATRAA